MKNLFYILLLILGIPVGLLLARLCKEEIKSWKKRLFVMLFVCLILIVLVAFLSFEYKIPVIISLFFVVVTCLIIVWKANS